MALTQSQWVPAPSVQGKSVWNASVVATTAENDAYTVKTPKELDLKRPFQLFIKYAATPDGQATPLDLWLGYGDNFALSGDGANVVATNGAKYKQILDDSVLAVSPLVYVINFDPDLPVAEVVTAAAIATGLKIRVPKGIPYLAFNVNGGSTLAATTHYYTIVQ